MKINFEKIIATANTRKEKLEDLISAFDHMKEVLEPWNDFRNYLSDANEAYKNLDHEGRMMLPPPVKDMLDDLALYKQRNSDHASAKDFFKFADLIEKALVASSK